MLFLISWTGRPELRQAAIDRFLQSRGQPPESVKMLGRWHSVGPISGFAIAESNDATALQKWVLDWNDVFKMEVHPAVTDEQLGSTLAALKRA
jgi:hypothetical protein